jgi:hypothetical protein
MILRHATPYFCRIQASVSEAFFTNRRTAALSGTFIASKTLREKGQIQAQTG